MPAFGAALCAEYVKCWKLIFLLNDQLLGLSRHKGIKCKEYIVTVTLHGIHIEPFITRCGYCSQHVMYALHTMMYMYLQITSLILTI